MLIKLEAPNLLENEITASLMFLTASLFCLATWVYSFSEYIDYYLDTWIITNLRIINIEQHGLFSRTASELYLGDVQDVTSEVKGVIPTLFDYGSVYVQTAGERQRFHFKDIDHPEKTKEKILRLVDEHRAKRASSVPPVSSIPPAS